MSDLAILWWHALTQGAIWRRALVIGLVAGFLQVAVNQGDVWWRGVADGRVIFKTVMSPLIALGLALMAAAWTDVSRQRSVVDPSYGHKGSGRDDAQGDI
jgi:hypothetical protein